MIKQDQKIKTLLTEALKEVFVESDTKDPEMKVLIRRIPILCASVEAIHKNIDSINNNIQWITRLIIGTITIGLLGTYMKSNGII